MLQDVNINTYEVVERDPTRRMITSLHVLLVSLKEKNIANSTYRSLLSNVGILPRPYALPKVHKQDCPFRIIVSSMNSPLYSIAVFLHNIIIKTIPKAGSHIENSFKLGTKEFDGRCLSDEFQLMSLDVVSLFTNVH